MFIFETFMLRSGFLLLFVVWAGPGLSQAWFTKVNLTDSVKWLPATGNKGMNRVAHVDIYTGLYRGDALVIESAQPFYVFAEGKLLGGAYRHFRWPIDSLSGLFPQQPVRLMIYKTRGAADNLQVLIQSQLPVAANENTLLANIRTAGAYRDLLLSLAFLLTVLLLVMARTNRLLLISYADVGSLMAYRESEDHPMYNRVTNTTNVLLVIGVMLLYAALAAAGDAAKSFAELWGLTLYYAGKIGFLLLLKGLVVWVISAWFGIGHLKGLQYVGFVRYLACIGFLLLIAEMFLTFVAGTSPVNLLSSPAILFTGSLLWVWLLWRKLRYQTHFGAIHLFSYLCATEVGPLLLTATNWKA
jgi:hypothetical protein